MSQIQRFRDWLRYRWHMATCSNGDAIWGHLCSEAEIYGSDG